MAAFSSSGANGLVALSARFGVCGVAGRIGIADEATDATDGADAASGEGPAGGDEGVTDAAGGDAPPASTASPGRDAEDGLTTRKLVGPRASSRRRAGTPQRGPRAGTTSSAPGRRRAIDATGCAVSEPRVRLDVLLVERGLAETRQKAQALVIAGHVYQGEKKLDKPGSPVARAVELEVRGRDNPYVSRGGLKLKGALDSFRSLGLHVDGAVALDVGASTGGFTDCLLQHGARRVYAVDVGKGLLHARLRADPRVVVREGENARFLCASSFDEPIELVVVDASFIGLSALLAPIAATLRAGGALCALVKPQFEAGRDAVARGRGVIRDEAVREAAIARVREALSDHALTLVAESDATVRGPKGNLERFVYARRAA